MPTEGALQLWVAEHTRCCRPAAGGPRPAADTHVLGMAFWDGLRNSFSVAASDRQWMQVRKTWHGVSQMSCLTQVQPKGLLLYLAHL